MQLTPVACQNCGASLEIPDNARFVTCQFCRTQLSVQHTGSAIYTELLGDLAETTARMAENLEAIRIQNEIEKLDREWEETRTPYLTHAKDGSTSEPDSDFAVGSGLLLLGAGIVVFIVFLIMAAQDKQFPLPWLALAAFAALTGVYQMTSGREKAAAYEKLRHAYEEERQSLEQRLREFPVAD